jgi:predicted porin
VQSLSSDTFAFNAHRAFGRRWTTSMGLAYSRSQDQSGISSSENVSGTTQIRYQLTNQLSASVNYSHMRQEALSGPSATITNIRNVDRNSVSIGLIYDIGVIARR